MISGLGLNKITEIQDNQVPETPNFDATATVSIHFIMDAYIYIYIIYIDIREYYS